MRVIYDLLRGELDAFIMAMTATGEKHQRKLIAQGHFVKHLRDASREWNGFIYAMANICQGNLHKTLRIDSVI